LQNSSYTARGKTLVEKRNSFEAAVDSISDWIVQKPVLLLFALIVLNFTAAALHYREVDPDLFARVATGKIIVDSGAVPHQDIFAFTPTKTVWLDHEWLLSPLFYLTAKNGGDLGLFVLKLLSCSLFFLLLLSALIKRTAGSSRGAALLWLVILIPDLFNPWLPTIRCQALTFLAFATLLYAFVRHGQGSSKTLWALPPLFIIWTNGHGGVLAGLGTLALLVLRNLCERKYLLFFIGIACAAALLVNPYGIEYIVFLFEAGLKTRELVPEWDSVDVLTFHGAYFLLVAALFFIGSLRSNSPYRHEAIYVGAPIAVAGFFSQRLTPLFFMWALLWGLPAWLWFIEYVRKYLPGFSLRMQRSVVITAAMFSLYSAGYIALHLPLISRFTLDYSAYPVRELDWLRSHYRGGKLLVHFNEGSYALWKLYPHFQISLDGRYEEVYPDSTVNRVLHALTIHSPLQRTALASLNPDFVLLHRASEERARHKEFFGEFTPVFDGERFSILAKSSGAAPTLQSDRSVLPMWDADF